MSAHLHSCFAWKVYAFQLISSSVCIVGWNSISLLALWQLFKLFQWVLNRSSKMSVMQKHRVCLVILCGIPPCLPYSPGSHSYSRSNSRAQSPRLLLWLCCLMTSTHDQHTLDSTQLHVYGCLQGCSSTMFEIALSRGLTELALHCWMTCTNLSLSISENLVYYNRGHKFGFLSFIGLASFIKAS